eukprot:2406465-Rhodomonas_salina.1
MITATEYLPLPDPLLSPWRCASSSAFTRHIPPLLETLETLFLPATPELCAKPLLFTPDVASQFGANVRGLLLAATTAVQSQRSLVFGGGWTYLEHELCPSALCAAVLTVDRTAYADSSSYCLVVRCMPIARRTARCTVHPDSSSGLGRRTLTVRCYGRTLGLLLPPPLLLSCRGANKHPTVTAP